MNKALLMMLGATLGLMAQNAYVADAKGQWDMVKGNLLKAAQAMPEADYGFKPVDSVRSFGQLVGHVADANKGMCAAISGQKPTGMMGIEKNAKTKADLVKGLEESIAFCDSAMAGLSDAAAGEKAKLFGMEKSKLGWAFFASGHGWEHYGNISTYMRIKGMTPPSSERRQ